MNIINVHIQEVQWIPRETQKRAIPRLSCLNYENTKIKKESWLWKERSESSPTKDPLGWTEVTLDRNLNLHEEIKTTGKSNYIGIYKRQYKVLLDSAPTCKKLGRCHSQAHNKK